MSNNWISDASKSNVEVKVSGFGSSTSGVDTIASGYASNANGHGVIAEGYAATAIGSYNKKYDEDNPSEERGEYAFVIGSGTDETTRSNLFRIDWKGNAYATNAFHVIGDGYGRYYEWADKNKNNDDRIGYFVSLKDNKISIFSSENDYLLGVVCDTPAVITNSYGDNWHDMYLKDDWGRLLYEEVLVKDEHIGTTRKVIRPVINPEYDPTKQYISRSNRPEYSCIVDRGIIRVRSDGTCKANGFCKPTIQGIATASNSGFFVTRVLNSNIIEIIYRDGTTFL